jgi:ElaB/YqjD/DUF883 family membrane-anchored ribosome-binding protein
MEETRSHLAKKLEALESQVANTVESTTEAVAETVENVKETVENVTETVHETVQTVAKTFDIRHQVEQHPWAMVGGALAAGALAGYFLGGRSQRNGRWEQEEEASPPASQFTSAGSPSWHEQESRAPSYQADRHAEPHEEKKGWFREEIGRLGGLAISALMGVVREMTSRALPEALGKKVSEEVDHLTEKLGGEPIRGSLLPEGKDSGQGH